MDQKTEGISKKLRGAKFETKIPYFVGWKKL